MCREKTVNLLNLFLFTLNKHLFTIDVFEMFFANNFNFNNANHLIKIKKLKLLNINFKIKCFFSIDFMLKRIFLSFSINFFIFFIFF